MSLKENGEDWGKKIRNRWMADRVRSQYLSRRGEMVKIAKVLFVLGALVFPLGIYLSSFSLVGVILAIVGGLTVFLSTPAIQS